MNLFKKIFKMDTVEKVLETGEKVATTFSNKAQGTKRQQSDMLSDSWLSKSIRPIIAIWVLMLFTVFLILKGCSVELDIEIGKDIAIMTFIVFSFYFPGRTIEKWIKSKTEKK